MKILTKSLTAITLSLIITAPIVAGTPALDNRQGNQKARIANGVASGELTARESTRMVKGQVELQRMENRAKRDGVVTPHERAKLQRKATIESGKIYRNKHDGQKRPKARG